MIHPNTELRFVNDEIGYGVFATHFIPKGTIVYVKDDLEISVTPSEYNDFSPVYKQVIDKYSYRDENGNRIISWDIAKYVNHCCDFNSISTGYGFEIAIRDIYPNEQITDEYGLFNLDTPMLVNCGKAECRCIVTDSDIETYADDWDRIVQATLPLLWNVDQPLFEIVDKSVRKDLLKFRDNPSAYKSLRLLKLRDKAS